MADAPYFICMKKIENALTVKIVDGRMMCFTEDGKPLGGEVFVRLTDEVNERPYALVKCYVNLETEKKCQSEA